jgi:RND family efflux transporter MFP subunit
VRLKILLPLIVVGLALLGAFGLFATRKVVTPTPPERRLPAVRVSVVSPRTVNIQVRSQGTVMPRTESQLIPEVSGPAIWTSPILVSGGYFDAGERLVKIDPARYETAVERARATLERAIGEADFARQDLRRQEDLAEDEIISRTSFENANRDHSEAQANLRDARAALAEAERDLERTVIRAPFSGRVREERVDVGQFLSRGTSFATLYATDFLEIRLPVPDDQLAFFDTPLWTRTTEVTELPRVRLHTRFAGQEREWWGRIVRTEGEIDPKSRMVHVVARLENELTLPVGLFVLADIEARSAENVVVLPRAAMLDSTHVVVVDDEDRLRRRPVEVLRLDRDEALIASGLTAGERVCSSPPADFIDGQLVKPLEELTPEVGS